MRPDSAILFFADAAHAEISRSGASFNLGLITRPTERICGAAPPTWFLRECRQVWYRSVKRGDDSPIESLPK